MTNLLPKVAQERIHSFPEYSYGAHKVALIMKDESVIEDVIVTWGVEVVRVRLSTLRSAAQVRTRFLNPLMPSHMKSTQNPISTR